jgi:hypothetical protein
LIRQMPQSCTSICSKKWELDNFHSSAETESEGND